MLGGVYQRVQGDGTLSGQDRGFAPPLLQTTCSPSLASMKEEAENAENAVARITYGRLICDPRISAMVGSRNYNSSGCPNPGDYFNNGCAKLNSGAPAKIEQVTLRIREHVTLKSDRFRVTRGSEPWQRPNQTFVSVRSKRKSQRSGPRPKFLTAASLCLTGRVSGPLGLSARDQDDPAPAGEI